MQTSFFITVTDFSVSKSAYHSIGTVLMCH